MEDRKSTEYLTLHTVEDIELWCAHGEGWALPMFVQWLHDRGTDKHYAQITPAVSLYASQLKTMEALMQHHDLAGTNLKWIIPRRIAESILRKCSGVTPAFYYKWPDVNCPPMPPQWGITKLRQKLNDPPQNVESTFVGYVAKSRNLPAAIVQMVLNAVSESAPTWLLEKQQPIELGFCRLVALPFRANWKEIVAFKCRKWSLLSIFRKDDDMWVDLRDAGLPGILTSPHNIALKRGLGVRQGSYRIDYTIECIPTAKFKAAINLVEARRMSCGTTTYVASFEKTVEKLYVYIVQALANYVSKASSPFAGIRTSGRTGLLSFLPLGRKKEQVRQLSIKRLPVHIIPPDSGFSVLGAESDARLIQAQTEPMPKVSPVLQIPQDMRQPQEQRYLETSGDRPSGNSGVPVLDANQGTDTRGPMLPITAVNTTARRLDEL